MMKGIRYSFSVVFLGIASFSIQGQSFFNKYLQPIDSLNPNPSDLEVLDDKILISALYSDNESAVHRLNLNGEKVSDHFYQDFSSAGKAILYVNDVLYYWGKNRDQDKGLELLRLDEEYSVDVKKEIQSNGVWNFPSTSSDFGDSIVTLSIFRDEGSDQLRGTVHMISQDLEELWSKQLHPESSFVNVFSGIELSSGHLLVSSQYSTNNVNGSVTVYNSSGISLRQKDMPEEITSGYPVTIVELSNGDIICGTVVDRLFDFEFQQNQWYEAPTKYYWLSGSNLQEQKDTIYTSPKLESPGGERLWKGNGDYFFIHGNVWYVDEDQTYGMLKKVDNDGNILWSRRYQHEDFTGSKNFHGIEHIQEMPDGSIYTAGSAKLVPGRNHIWIMHLDEHGCLGDDCGEVVITDVEDIKSSAGELTIYPNPVQDVLTIDNLDISEVYSYSIVDQQGRLLKTGSISQSAKSDMSVSSLPPGVYYINISSSETRSDSYKFVVK